jgi:hypothetical protein
VTDEQIRLYAIARAVVPAGIRLRTFGEPAAGGVLYTLELEDGNERRWLAIHDTALRKHIPDWMIAKEIRRALERRPASPARPA